MDHIIEVTFEEVKEILKEKFASKIKFLNVNEELILLEGFISHPYTIDLSNKLLIGGPTIPLVAVIGNESGAIYFFSYYEVIKGQP